MKRYIFLINSLAGFRWNQYGVFLLFKRERDIFSRTLVYGVYVFETFLKSVIYNVSSIISFLKL